MNVQADKHRVEHHYEVGDWVYVKLQPYRQRTLLTQGYSKLASLYYVPFQIEQKVGQVAYKLLLPLTCTVHPTFHVSKLKRSTRQGAEVQASLPKNLDVTVVVLVAVRDRHMVQRGSANLME